MPDDCGGGLHRLADIREAVKTPAARRKLADAAATGSVAAITLPSICQTFMGDSGNSTAEVVAFVAYLAIREACATYRAVHGAR